MRYFKDIHSLYKACSLPGPNHPLISVFSFDSPITAFSDNLDSFKCDFYIIAFKKIKDGMMLYGRSKYDHQNGTMSFTKPGQIIQLKNVEFEEKGFVIAFHKDFILHEASYHEIISYGFFDYEIDEALHISKHEEETIWLLYQKIEEEYNANQDDSSKPIILSHISSMLRYANRYYKRQFINRRIVSKGMISKFETLLNNKLNNEFDVLPSVNQLALELGISARYLSDLMKQETGMTAIEHIHLKLVDKAKNLLLVTDLSISETAYKLGFDHPTYFSRLFKKQSGLTPKEFRKKHSN